MQRSFLNIRQVHRDLRHSIFLDIPADGLHVLQHSRDANRFAVFVEHLFARRAAVLRLDPAIFPNIKSDRVGPPR